MATIPVVQSSNVVQPGSGTALSDLAKIAGGGAAGYGLNEMGHQYNSMKRNATVGLVTGLFSLGMGLLTSNSAITPANAAMSSFNAVNQAPGAFATSDITNLKVGGQQLTQALQQLTWGGWSGVSNVTPPTASPSVAVSAPTSNIGTAVVIGGGLLALAYFLA